MSANKKRVLCLGLLIFVSFIHTPIYNETFNNTITFNGTNTLILKADDVCGSNPLDYIRMIIPTFKTEKFNRTTECIITAFDRSHEAEASSMIISMTTDCYHARMLIYNFGISNEYKRVFTMNSGIELIAAPQGIPDFARTFQRHNKGFKPFVITDAISRGCETAYWADPSIKGIMYER